MKKKKDKSNSVSLIQIMKIIDRPNVLTKALSKGSFCVKPPECNYYVSDLVIKG